MTPLVKLKNETWFVREAATSDVLLVMAGLGKVTDGLLVTVTVGDETDELPGTAGGEVEFEAANAPLSVPRLVKSAALVVVTIEVEDPGKPGRARSVFVSGVTGVAAAATFVVVRTLVSVPEEGRPGTVRAVDETEVLVSARLLLAPVFTKVITFVEETPSPVEFDPAESGAMLAITNCNCP